MEQDKSGDESGTSGDPSKYPRVFSSTDETDASAHEDSQAPYSTEGGRIDPRVNTGGLAPGGSQASDKAQKYLSPPSRLTADKSLYENLTKEDKLNEDMSNLMFPDEKNSGRDREMPSLQVSPALKGDDSEREDGSPNE